MTPAQRAHRDKLAEDYGKYNTQFDDEFTNDKRAYSAGYDAAHAEAEVLVKALDRAIEVMEFAYMNLPAQPKEISEAREALMAWRRE